ncbi:major facilitator superfamily domain-containing protein 12-like isoform X1 [Apostichopus japonicus]|uniref:major facilitator superfamily domain-containing protein 12-like isoform X1 n=1 Tax=Stichopus japonicus TaxID=307972 RepID=UPI003AB4D396
MENQPLLKDSRTRMPLVRRFTYGVGHILNDLCASMWFTYLVVYFHRVLEFDNAFAGYVMMTGQVFDAISTPLVGYESDVSKGCFKYGRRKSWHLMGSVCVAIAFIFIFQPCIGCDDNTDTWAKFIYYVPFLFLAQFGWASVQISHLALIPELTSCEHERVELNTIRYTFTVVSNVVVFVIMWLLLTFVHSPHTMKPESLDKSLGPEDIIQFRYLIFIVVAIGSVFCFIFHIGTKEKRSRSLSDNFETSQSAVHSRMAWKDWLKCVQFYQVAGIYMCTRLMVNVSQVYVPLYVTDTLGLSKDYVALIPLVIYLSGFVVSSIIVKPLNRFLGRKMTFFFGAVLVLGACDWILAGNLGKQVFGVAILLGAGGSMALVTSLSMTADLINQNTESGAFVYGAMSFTDKLSNGIAVLVIQLIHPCRSGCCAACATFYQVIMAYIPGGAALLSLIVLATLIGTKIGERKPKPVLADHHGDNNTIQEPTEDLEQVKNDNQEELIHCTA